ncbi:MAG: PDZ domain-containing protein, partial [Clostridiales bacterium]|nr:PDZ domain-containing protein [Clostridiales bacterium]
TNQMIQVDAAISSGNSGGGMFNILGQLQGIPTLKFDSNSGGSIFGFSSGPSIDNIGMCIPINAAKPLLQSVLEDYQGDAAIEGKQAAEADKPKPRIGVTIKTLPPSHPLVADQSLPQGAYVVEVVEGEPADLAGIKVGDIIVEGNGEIIRSSTDLVMFVESSKDGDAIEMKLFRAEGLADIIDGKANPDILGEGEYITVEVHPVITNLDM